MKKYQNYEFDISEINAAGKGLSILDGVETIIPYALPGQRVDAFVHKKKHQHADARLKKVLQPRPDEIKPFCAHFGQPPTPQGQGCGGCSWQQISYQTQLDLKQNMLSKLLADVVDTPVNLILGSPIDRHYRNKVELSFGDKLYISEEDYLSLKANKTPMPTGSYLGFHVPGSFGTLVDIQTCHLMSEALTQVYHCIREVLPRLGGEVYSPRHHTGFWRHLVLRHGLRSGQIMVHFNTTDQHRVNWEDMIAALLQLKLKDASVHSILHSIHTGDAQIVGWNTPQLLWGEPVISESLCGLNFEISPYAFFQTNTLAAETLYQQIVRMSHLEHAPVVYDLYSGTGSIGMVLARHGASRVYGLEEIVSAVEDAQRNALANGLENCQFMAGKVETLLPELLQQDKPDLIVIDPPRAGLHPKVPNMLAQIAAPQIIYVSCNPAALARDLALLQSHYTVEEIQPVDLFPQTGHLETIVRLERK